jgi:hypothetical protein
MKTPASAICSLTAAVALLALPASAMAEYLVPPGNSAVNQYTETYPSAGGQKQAGKGQKTAKHPTQVLGGRNAHKLDQQGADGRETAELAAETAPGTSAASPENGGGQDKRNGGGGTGGGSEAGEGAGRQQSSSGDAGDGSSGLGSVISQATGSSSSGELGLLLPLAILVAIAWSVFYLLRQRKRPTA